MTAKPRKAAVSSPASQIRSYFAALPPDVRKVVKKLRADVRAAVPDAVESVSYGIPTLKLDGRPLIYYAGFKQHVSLYPMGAAIRRQFADDLKGCGFSTGTIRFPVTNPPSSALVKRLVKARIAEVHAKRSERPRNAGAR